MKLKRLVQCQVASGRAFSTAASAIILFYMLTESAKQVNPISTSWQTGSLDVTQLEEQKIQTNW